MKIPELYRDGRFSLSFEVFPPKSADGMELLWQTIDRLVEFQPGFISCTYGAGGATQRQTLEIVDEIRRRWNQPATAHFTCVGSNVEQLREWLGRASERGVENIMALRGDPPRGEEKFTAVRGGLSYANQLVALIRSEFPDFGIGVAGYPETHQEAPSPEFDLENLKRKLDAGGDAVFTQLFYDNDDFLRFRDRCAAIGIDKPIVPGILPILNFAQIQRITKLCKAKLPTELVSRLERCGEDTLAQAAVGIEHASRQCEGLLAEGVPGIHFYVLNKYEATSRILSNLGDRLPVAAA